MKDVAIQARSYIDGDKRKYIHLVDGGVADNLGLRGPAERALELEHPETSRANAIRLPRRIAMIIVDANTDKDYGWDSKDVSLGRKALLGSIQHVVLTRYSFETIELFREVSTRLSRERKEARVLACEIPPEETEIYIIELHFNQMADDADRRFFNSVPTSLQLPPATVDRLEHLAREQLEHNPEFRKLIQDLQRPHFSRGLIADGKVSTNH